MDLHYPALRIGPLRWLPWGRHRCCCGSRRCRVLVTQERARAERELEAHWDERQL